MKRKTIVAAGIALLVAIPAAVSAQSGMGPDRDQPITNPALERATEAALRHVGEGTVTETEVGDEESMYEVEVTRDDGTQVDVQLDDRFAVVGTEEDGSDDARD